MICGYTKQHLRVKYEYHVQIYFDQKNYTNYFHIIFLELYVFNYSFNVFQQLTKKTLAFYESTNYELNITIKIPPEATDFLPLFTNYIEYWRVTCWKTEFFKLFKSNDGIMKKKTF